MKFYETMKVQIILFCEQDVITTSGNLPQESDDTVKDFEW